MMNEDLKQNLLSTSQTLVDRGEYEQALSCLNTMECVMASWLKGKIYLSVAEELSKSFTFMFYATSEMKSKHRNLLNEAYNHLYNAALLMPTASHEIREHLNKCLWNQISKVEHELTATRTIVEEQRLDIFEDEHCLQENQNTEHLIDQITDWNL